MFEYNFFNEWEREPYPDYFDEWDEAIREGRSPGFVDAEELCDIIDIYFEEDDVDNARYAIDYALKLYPNDEDIIYDILLLLNDYERWNDLLVLAEKYADMPQVWADGHKLAALLHLGMEEDAFHFFRKMKNKHVADYESLFIFYQVMGEALYEVDLYDACIDVMEEAIEMMGQDPEFYWLQLQSYLAFDDNDNVADLCKTIQKLRPLDGETWNRLAFVYKDIDETAKEIEAFEFAHSLGYKDPASYINLIYAYEKNGNLKKALEYIEEYIPMQPDNYFVLLMAANISSQLDNWQKSLSYINDAINIKPELDSLYSYKANFLTAIGENQKAIKALEEGIQKTGDPEGELAKQIKSINQNIS